MFGHSFEGGAVRVEIREERMGGGSMPVGVFARAPRTTGTPPVMTV